MSKIVQISIVLILLVNLSGLIGCSNDNNTAYSPIAPAPAASPASGPIKVELSVPFAPALNQAIDVNCAVSSIYDVTDLQVTITSRRRLISQDGADTVWPPYATGDNITQTFNIKANQPVSFSSQIVFKEIGFWRITASSTGYAPVTDKYWGDEADLYLTINADNGAIGWPLPGPAIYQQLENGKWVPVPFTAENETHMEDLPPTPALKPDGTWTPVEKP